MEAIITLKYTEKPVEQCDYTDKQTCEERLYTVLNLLDEIMDPYEQKVVSIDGRDFICLGVLGKVVGVECNGVAGLGDNTWDAIQRCIVSLECIGK